MNVLTLKVGLHIHSANDQNLGHYVLGVSPKAPALTVLLNLHFQIQTSQNQIISTRFTSNGTCGNATL